MANCWPKMCQLIPIVDGKPMTQCPKSLTQTCNSKRDQDQTSLTIKKMFRLCVV